MRVGRSRRVLALLVAAISLAPAAATAVPGEKPQIMCVMKNRTEVCYAQTMTVTSSGLDAEAAAALIEAFDLGSRIRPTDVPALDEHGVFRFLDNELFQQVPSLLTVTPPDATLPREIPEELHLLSDPGEPLPALDVLNLPGLGLALLNGENAVLGDAAATDAVLGGLTEAGLVPPRASANVSNTTMQFSLNSDSLLPGLPGLGDGAEWVLDTRVSLSTDVGDVPVRGPGANVSFTLNPDGVLTQAQYALRGLTGGGHRRIIHPDMGASVCRDALGLAIDAPVSAELVYYAPPLDLAVTELLPHFDCNAILPEDAPTDATVPMSRFVPASADAPRAGITFDVDGRVVSATGAAQGGTAPYSFAWSSATVGGIGDGGSEVSYEVGFDPEATPNDTSVIEELLTLTVTDANGLAATAAVAIVIDLTTPDPDVPVEETALAVPRLDGARGGSHSLSGNQVASWSGTNSPSCTPYTTGFRDFTDSSPAPRPQVRWTWSTNASWESDFKSDTIAGGNDHSYVDDVDMAFYCGHGSPNGFGFENSYGPTDKNLHYSEARWGDRDLEWFALLSCQVLAETSGGLTTAQRWGSAFDGLHEMMGFHTNAYPQGNLGQSLAFYAQGSENEYYSMAPWKVHNAFVQAAVDSQPDGTVWATLLPVSYSNTWNRNDYFHGRGWVSSDISADQIYYFVRYTGTV